MLTILLINDDNIISQTILEKCPDHWNVYVKPPSIPVDAIIVVGELKEEQIRPNSLIIHIASTALVTDNMRYRHLMVQPHEVYGEYDVDSILFNMCHDMILSQRLPDLEGNVTITHTSEIIQAISTCIRFDIIDITRHTLSKRLLMKLLQEAWINQNDDKLESGVTGLCTYVYHLKKRWELPPGYIRRRADGVIFHTQPPTITYDKKYVAKYQELSSKMSYLRLGALDTALTEAGVTHRTSILDVGYGDGAFLRASENAFDRRFGTDISTFPVPKGVTQVASVAWQRTFYQVICFFDSLEHFEDINFVKSLNCDFIFISVPNCHYRSLEWFKSWRHRRAGEHIYHFSASTLDNFFKSMGYTPVTPFLDHENIIRINNEQPERNILSCLYRKVT